MWRLKCARYSLDNTHPGLDYWDDDVQCSFEAYPIVLLFCEM